MSAAKLHSEVIVHPAPWSLPSDYQKKVQNYEEQKDDDLLLQKPAKSIELDPVVMDKVDNLMLRMGMAIYDCLSEWGVSHERIVTTIGQVRTLLREDLLPNSLTHAHLGDPNKPLIVEWKIDEQHLRVAIEDAGTGFDVRKQLKTELTEPNFRLEGRGLLMAIAHAGTRGEIRWRKDGRRVVLRKDLTDIGLADTEGKSADDFLLHQDASAPRE